MTFSEDDIDPYKRVKIKGNPECLKTIFMQWTMLDPHMDQGRGFVMDMDPAKLASMAVFDVEADLDSDSGNYLYAVPDFPSVFERAVAENVIEDVRRKERRAELWPAISELFDARCAPMRAQVEKCLEDELKSLGIPQTTLAAMNIRTKVSTAHMPVLIQSSFPPRLPTDRGP